LFVSDDGRVFGPTARTIWDRLIDLPAGLRQATDDISEVPALQTFGASRVAAESHGAPIFDELLAAHQSNIARERKKGGHAYSSRRRAIERLGLPQVRSYRLRILADEEQAWNRDLTARESALPDLAAVLMVRVAPAGVSV
jgi:hypothetical protein